MQKKCKDGEAFRPAHYIEAGPAKWQNVVLAMCADNVQPTIISKPTSKKMRAFGWDDIGAVQTFNHISDHEHISKYSSVFGKRTSGFHNSDDFAYWF